MALVPAKCTQCGGNIEVDNTHEAGICQHCGTPFITEKAINNYTTNITNNIVNNNNFNGANVTIQNDNNIDGLLLLANRELELKYYRSKDLQKYLEEIVVKSPTDGSKKIIELFREMGLYKAAESVVNRGVSIDKADDIAYLLTKYDSQNVLGWLMEWKISVIVKDVEVGESIIRYADEESKAEYEKEVYSYFVQHGPRCAAYKKYLSAVPQEFIRKNRYIQDLLIEQVNNLVCFTEREKKDRIEYIKHILPSDRLSDIKIPETSKTNNSSGGCYIATCVYGSYDCPQVWTLRRYRDYTLDETWHGRLFIKCYYAVSPKLVKWFGNYAWFRKPWKKFLDGMVERLNSEGVADTKYSDKY